MKKLLLIFGFLLLIPGISNAQGIFTTLPDISNAVPAESRLRGKVLLQVEANGEAWYVTPDEGARIYMKDGEAAYQIMRNLGLGITDSDLSKIPFVSDTDEMEGSVSVCSNNSLANRVKGQILLQVEQNGEAWYVEPDKCRRIYMKDGDIAYQIMKFLSLGISNIDLAKISYYNNSAVSYDWKTYENLKYGFSFRYPSDWPMADWVDDEERPDYVKVFHPNASWNFAVCPDPQEKDCRSYVYSYTNMNKTESEVTLLDRRAIKVEYSYNTPCEKFGCVTTYTFIDKPEGWGEYNGWEDDTDILLNWSPSEQGLILKSILSTFKFLDD